MAEYASFRGAFDHRKAPGTSGGQRYQASVAGLARDAIVHVGHSTHLLVVDGVRCLTDPWFYDPAFGALAHDPAPAVMPDGIGALDLVLITHDHADHADLRAIDQLDKRAAVICATSDLASRIRQRGFSDVAVLAAWESKKHRDITVHAVPGLHDIYEIGFVVQGATQSVYFAGDTRLHPDLPAIAERLKPTFAILPVDGTRLTGGAMHVMTPQDAVQAAQILKVKHVMPSHAEAWFTDPIAEHVLASSIRHASSAFGKICPPEIRCSLPLPGEAVILGT